MSVSAEGLIWLVWRLRCGNDAPWKSGKSQKSDFPPIPTTLGNPHKTRVSTFPPATAAEGTMKANTAEPLESRGCSDSCTEPKNRAGHIFRSAAFSLHHSATPLGHYLRRMTPAEDPPVDSGGQQPTHDPRLQRPI